MMHFISSKNWNQVTFFALLAILSPFQLYMICHFLQFFSETLFTHIIFDLLQYVLRHF